MAKYIHKRNKFIKCRCTYFCSPPYLYLFEMVQGDVNHLESWGGGLGGLHFFTFCVTYNVKCYFANHSDIQ